MEQKQSLNKQALELIIAAYLDEKPLEELNLLQKYHECSNGLAASLNSNHEKGLSSYQLLENQKKYGKNKRSLPRQYKIDMIKKACQEQLHQLFVYIFFIVTLSQIVIGYVWNDLELKQSGWSILVFLSLLMGLKIGVKWRIAVQMQKEICKKEANLKFKVLRDGNMTEIAQHHILVGDILHIQIGQIIPASGIIISNKQILIDETIFDRGLQKKSSIENCLKEIEKKSHLELIIQLENKSIPSPVILRSCELVGSRQFFMLVLAVEESELLQKVTSGRQFGKKHSSIERWMDEAEKFLQRISYLGVIGVMVVYTFTLIVKIINLEQSQLLAVTKSTLESMHPMLLSFFFFRADTLILFFKAQYLNLIMLLQNNTLLDNLLTVQQIFITDSNICKYDEIIIKKIALCDQYNILDFSLLPAFPPTIKAFVSETLTQVGFSHLLPHQKSESIRKNIIVHINNAEEKIVSSLREPVQKEKVFQQKTKAVQQKTKAVQNQANQESLNQLIKADSRKMDESNHPQQQKRIDLKKQFKDEIKKEEDIKQKSNKVAPASPSLKKGRNSNHLSSYLQEILPFGTHTIIDGLNRLAQSHCSTYYYQKYSIKRLSMVKQILEKGVFSEMSEQHQQKIMKTAMKLVNEGLVPVLIGVSNGAYNKHYMNNLIAMIGVEIKYENQISQKIRELECMGITSTIALLNKDYDEEVLNQELHEVNSEFIKRKWISPQQYFCNFEDIAQEGGNIICKHCEVKQCDCQTKTNELSNIQGFMSILNDVRCIYNLDSEGLEYLECGYQQINKSTIKVISYDANTKQIVNEILACHKLIISFSKGISLWLTTLLLLLFCMYPLNLISFNNIFSYQQIYFILLLLQILMLESFITSKHDQEQIIKMKIQGKLDHNRSQKPVCFEDQDSFINRRIKNMFSFSQQVEVFTYLLANAVTYLCFLYQTEIFLSTSLINTFLQNYNCSPLPSFYQNSDADKYECVWQGQPIILNSSLSTIILQYFIISIWLKNVLTLRNGFKIKNFIFYFMTLSIPLLLTYFLPQSLQTYKEGLCYQELLFVSAFAILTNILSKIFEIIMRCGCKLGDKNQRNDFIVSEKNNKYVAGLKHYEHVGHEQNKQLEY